MTDTWAYGRQRLY